MFKPTWPVTTQIICLRSQKEREKIWARWSTNTTFLLSCSRGSDYCASKRKWNRWFPGFEISLLSVPLKPFLKQRVEKMAPNVLFFFSELMCRVLSVPVRPSLTEAIWQISQILGSLKSSRISVNTYTLKAFAFDMSLPKAHVHFSHIHVLIHSYINLLGVLQTTLLPSHSWRSMSESFLWK